MLMKSANAMLLIGRQGSIDTEGHHMKGLEDGW